MPNFLFLHSRVEWRRERSAGAGRRCRRRRGKRRQLGVGVHAGARRRAICYHRGAARGRRRPHRETRELEPRVT